MIHNQSWGKNDITQHMDNAVLIIMSKDMADYDSLKAKGTMMKVTWISCSEYMMISLFCLTYFSEKERDAVIALIDSTPYKDLIVGNKSHVITY